MRLAALAIWAALGGDFGLGGCSRSEPPPPAEAPPPTVPVSELARDRDACKAYVAKVCDCAKRQPSLNEQCKLARALPDALETAAEVSASADSARRDVVQTNSAVRHIAKECIEEVAKLAAAGCQ